MLRRKSLCSAACLVAFNTKSVTKCNYIKMCWCMLEAPTPFSAIIWSYFEVNLLKLDHNCFVQWYSWFLTSKDMEVSRTVTSPSELRWAFPGWNWPLWQTLTRTLGGFVGGHDGGTVLDDLLVVVKDQAVAVGPHPDGAGVVVGERKALDLGHRTIGVHLEKVNHVFLVLQ